MPILVDKWSGRLSSAYTLWPLVPAGIVSGLFAYLSTGVDWISQWGAFGWAGAGLVAFFVFASGIALTGLAREKWVLAGIERQRAKAPDAINPVDKAFIGKRIRLTDLVRPSTNYIRNKTFTDCQLVGPMLVSLGNSSMVGSGFINCNWVVVRHDATIWGAIEFQDVVVRGGDISDVTILVHEAQLSFLKHIPAQVLNRTGDPEIDARGVPLRKKNF